MIEQVFDQVRANLDINDVPTAEDLLQKIFRYFIVTEPNISNLASVSLLQEVPTARINRKGNIEIGVDFFRQYILTINDLRFILQHEHAHKVIDYFMATTPASPYLAVLEKRGHLGFIQDAIINLSLLHVCASNLPERYYETPTLTCLLQRKPEIKRIFGNQLTEELVPKLSQLLASEQLYIKTRDLLALGDVTLKLSEFLILLNPPSGYSNDMVDSSESNALEKSENPGVSIKRSESGGDKYGGAGASSSHRPIVDIAIPITQKVTSREVEYVLPQLGHYFSELSLLRVNVLNALEQVLLSADVGKPYLSYSQPTATDLVKLASHIVTPWTEQLSIPHNRVLYFDVSGSILRFLPIVVDLFLSLRDQIGQYYAFSGIVWPIEFTGIAIRTRTDYNTRLNAVVNHALKYVLEGELFIISDGKFNFSNIEVYSINEMNRRFKTYLLKVSREKTLWPEALIMEEILVV